MTIEHETDSHEDDQALEALGLTFPIIRNAVVAWVDGRNKVGPLMPPMLAGLWAWGSCVEALRSQLLDRGWLQTTTYGLESVTNPELKVAIFVTSGDENTGKPGRSCQSRYRRGISTIAAIEHNVQQLSLFDLLPNGAHVAPQANLTIWALVLHRTAHEVQFELSLPDAISDTGHVSGWKKCIKFEPIPLHFTVDPVATDDEPAVDVTISRKVGS